MKVGNFHSPKEIPDEIYDIEFCKNCEHCVFIDELLNHIVYNSETIYYNFEYYDKNIHTSEIVRCTYGSTNIKVPYDVLNLYDLYQKITD
jgi:hypothetical protein